MLLPALVLRMDISTSPLVVVGGFAPGGMNVNNNNYIMGEELNVKRAMEQLQSRSLERTIRG